MNGAVVRALPAPGRAVRIGRAPDNDLVIANPEVSGYHAVLDWDGAVLRVHDLGSTNGTFLEGGRVDEPTPVPHSARVRLGTSVELDVQVTLESAPAPPAAWVWHRDTGRCHALHPEPQDLSSLLGAGELEEGPWTIRLGDGGAQLEGPDGALALPVGEPVVVGGAHLQIVDRGGAMGDTAAAGADPFWRIRVAVDGRAGPTAEVLAPGARSRGEIRAANRVVVLHLLAERALADAADGAAEADHGWVDDEVLMRGVWGRQWSAKGPAAFQVLVHRLRKDLARLGLAGGVVQKRAGNTRLRPGLVEVTLVGADG
jgi:hypothetical protein